MAEGTTTTTSTPWSAIQPYLVGGVGGTPGIADQAAALYAQQKNGMPDYLNQMYNNSMNLGMTYSNNPVFSQLNQNLQGMLANPSTISSVGPTASPMQVKGNDLPVNTAGYAPAFQPSMAHVATIGGQPLVTPDKINAALVDPVEKVSGVGAIKPAIAEASLSDLGKAMAGLGSANPMDAYQRMMTGKADTSTLNPVVDAALRRMGDNFNEQVMPAINQGATAAGQYGSSRQGIAQGIASKALAQSMGDTSANMYNNAYNQAQNMMGTAAGQLGNMALTNTENNANRATQVAIENARAQAAAAEAAAAREQAAMMMNSQQSLQRSLANQSSQNSASSQNANLGLTAQTANQNNALNVGQFNAGAQNTAANNFANQNLTAGLNNTNNMQQVNLANSAAQNQATQNFLNRDLTAQTANQSANMASDQFNANLGLQNNAQSMSNFNNNVNALNTGANMYNSAFNTQGNLNNLGLGAAQNANNYNWQQLGNYQSVIQPMAGMGGQQTTPYYTNTAGNMVGGALTGLALANQLLPR